MKTNKSLAETLGGRKGSHVIWSNSVDRCPRCGCYQWIYKGDRQVCADCGR
jgi:hypothetical protein